jgi:hypothetical protein
MNQYGDHALCCKRSGDRITRHNRMRNCLDSLLVRAGLNPVMEKKGLLGDGHIVDGRIPNDVAVPAFAEGKGLAIDVAVMSVHAKTSLDAGIEALENRVRSKRAKYQEAISKTLYDFVPIVFTTSGAVSSAGTEVIKQINRFGAKVSGERYIVHTNKTWALLSTTLQRSVALQCLTRMPKVSLEN